MIDDFNTVYRPGSLKIIVLSGTGTTGKSANNTIDVFFQPYIFVSFKTLGLIYRLYEGSAAKGVFFNSGVSIETNTSDYSKFSVIGLEWYEYPFMFTRYH